jgi:hypothetical protein
MATNIDKALYQAPEGIESLAQDAEPIEIEIVDPEACTFKIRQILRSTWSQKKERQKILMPI